MSCTTVFNFVEIWRVTESFDAYPSCQELSLIYGGLFSLLLHLPHK